MFNKRRSEIQIIKDILKLSKNGVKKTEILHQGNLSFSQLQNYLSYLIENEIIKENDNKRPNGSTNKIYITTEKGINLLEDIDNIYAYFK